MGKRKSWKGSNKDLMEEIGIRKSSRNDWSVSGATQEVGGNKKVMEPPDIKTMVS